MPVSDTVSLGAGFRIIHSSGTVKSTYLISREMEGDSIDYGYNLAVIYKPIPKLSVAATYRSNIDLNVEGNAKLYAGTSLVYNRITSYNVCYTKLLRNGSRICRLSSVSIGWSASMEISNPPNTANREMHSSISPGRLQ